MLTYTRGFYDMHLRFTSFEAAWNISRIVLTKMVYLRPKERERRGRQIERNRKRKESELAKQEQAKQRRIDDTPTGSNDLNCRNDSSTSGSTDPPDVLLVPWQQGDSMFEWKETEHNYSCSSAFGTFYRFVFNQCYI